MTSRRSFMAGIGAGVGAMAAGTVLRAAPAAKDPTIRVAVWETRRGGHTVLPKGTYDNVWLVKHLDSDVIISSGSKAAGDALAKALGYNVAAVTDTFSFFTRFPVEETYTFPGRGITVGGVKLNVRGRSVRVFGTQLKPSPNGDAPMSCEDEAKATVAVLAPYLKEADSVPVILGNAFDNHAALSWDDRAKCGCHYNRTGIPDSVVKTFADAGLKDTFRKGILAGGHKRVPLEGDAADKALNAPNRLQSLFCGGTSVEPVYSILAGGGFCGIPIKFRGEKRTLATYYGYMMADFRLVR